MVRSGMSIDCNDHVIGRRLAGPLDLKPTVTPEVSLAISLATYNSYASRISFQEIRAHCCISENGVWV
jgi:hypothetical protein